jgi:hypothetical protein
MNTSEEVLVREFGQQSKMELEHKQRMKLTKDFESISGTRRVTVQ